MDEQTPQPAETVAQEFLVVKAGGQIHIAGETPMLCAFFGEEAPKVLHNLTEPALIYMAVKLRRFFTEIIDGGGK